MNIALWLERQGRADPHRIAVARGTRPHLTYAQLARRAASLAGSLRSRYRLEPGDRVAVIARNTPEFIEILYGIWAAGLVAVPCNAKLHGAEIGYILEHSGTRVAFASDKLLATTASHAPSSLEHLIAIAGPDYQRAVAAAPSATTPRGPDDLAWLFYTSGTTGRPKGAMLTHRNLAVMAHAYVAEVDPTAPGDSILHAAPMSHGSGLYILPHIMRGATNVVPESGSFEPDEIFALAGHWRSMSLFAAPTMVKRMVASPTGFDVTALRTIVYGGGPMYVDDARAALDRFGPCIAQIYGQGESPMTITTLSREVIADTAHPRWLDRLASVGVPFSCLEVRTVDAEGRPATDGEIAVRGSTVMSGYWNNPEASADTIRDGWLMSGDMGTFDDEGYLTLKDRSKDVIISGGSNIYPREIEEVLQSHKAVREVSVIGRPDPEWGEIAIAYVVGDATPAALDALCLERIARFKRPKAYVFVEALPKNNYGKILKTELRARDRAALFERSE
ncbi:long-chain fatty acid--CoA ligase [Pseudaminobacter arsenicus]|uniref:Long-chain fatty acid--CoA ligase n=1 Tax=Borborobacter arsenicus TaxID=1851146 RepID=A0A432V0G7_9HYPH|nr:AMP-binding protein [Pseudaminobacter arsenicus]RUM95669.1 long-chain fatty acid--CoA ligase [Pseudaminobacter arsenicus]